jgi:adenylate cyclase
VSKNVSKGQIMYQKKAVFIIASLVTCLSLLFTFEPVFKYFAILTKSNYSIYDITLRLLGSAKNNSDLVVLVDIDDKSLKIDGHWPWSRDKVANLVKVLKANKAAVIVFDILFPEKEPNVAEILLQHVRQDSKVSVQVTNYLAQQESYFNNDQILAEAVSRNDVVLGIFFNDYVSFGEHGKPIYNTDKALPLLVPHASNVIGIIPVLAKAVNYMGFTNTANDSDGTIRRSPLVIEYQDDLYPSLALQAVRAYLLTDKFSINLRNMGANKIFLGMTLGDIYIPTDISGNILINYAGPAFSFPYISAANVLRNKFPAQIFEGKIVIVGSSAAGIGDFHSTPFQSIGYPGMEVHANIVSSIVNKNIISSPIWLTGIERILLVVVGIIFISIMVRFSVVGLLLTVFMLVGLIFLFNTLLLTRWQLILPHLILPYLQVIFLGVIGSGYGYLFEMRYRKRMYAIYGKYISSEHINKMLASHGKDTIESRSKVMTVLFADVQGFTAISEKLEAKEIKKFLSTLFTPLTAIIFDYYGTIDKYVGDMIMAFWNDPIDDENHATHGVQAALTMQQKIKELAPDFVLQKLTDVSVRIGVNSGIMHVGDMGSEYRKTYTVVGDAVNLGARLEDANKTYGTGILVSESTKDLCRGVIFRFIDNIIVKGKTSAINVYEPLCLVREKTGDLEAELLQYDAALQLYKASKWQEASKAFAQLVEKYPQVKIYVIYLKRINDFILPA